jgi:spore coat polysaccharide biosynthesis predicted glycosyltransferase SpsG
MDVIRGPILFRCDATPELGYEPFYQSLSLAASMQRRRRGTHFLCYLEPLSLAQTITRGNNDWIPAETPMGGAGDLQVTIREARRLEAVAVVVAANDLNNDYIAAINDIGVRVIAITTTPSGRNPAKLVVNPYLAPGSKAYDVGPGSQRLLGRKFSLVRALFRRQRTIRATEQPAPYRAMVAFGDDDHGDQTLLRTQQLLEMPKVDKVSIATRTHHPRYHELKDFAAESGGRVEVVTEPKELMTRLVRSHIALTSGDTWSLELCCVGIPQLLLPTRNDHFMNAKRLDDEGSATLLGGATDVNFEQLMEAVNIVLDDPMERLGMNRCGRNLVDGRGGDRIVNGMEIVLHTPAAVSQSRLRIAA